MVERGWVTAAHRVQVCQVDPESAADLVHRKSRTASNQSGPDSAVDGGVWRGWTDSSGRMRGQGFGVRGRGWFTASLPERDAKRLQELIGRRSVEVVAR